MIASSNSNALRPPIPTASSFLLPMCIFFSVWPIYVRACLSVLLREMATHSTQTRAYPWRVMRSIVQYGEGKEYKGSMGTKKGSAPKGEVGRSYPETRARAALPNDPSYKLLLAERYRPYTSLP